MYLRLKSKSLGLGIYWYHCEDFAYEVVIREFRMIVVKLFI